MYFLLTDDCTVVTGWQGGLSRSPLPLAYHTHTLPVALRYLSARFTACFSDVILFPFEKVTHSPRLAQGLLVEHCRGQLLDGQVTKMSIAV